MRHVNADGRVKVFYSTPLRYVEAKQKESQVKWPLKAPGTTWGAIRGPKCWICWGCWEVASWQFQVLQQLGWRKPHGTRSTQNKISGISHCCYSIHSFVFFLMSLALDLHFQRRMTFFPMLMVHTSCLACTIGILTFFKKNTSKNSEVLDGVLHLSPSFETLHPWHQCLLPGQRRALFLLPWKWN